MNKIREFFIGVVIIFWGVQACADEASVNVDADDGVVYPVSTQVVSGEEGGTRFLSLRGNVSDAAETAAETPTKDIGSDSFEWSYSRGVGTIPDQCPEGYGASVGVCAQICPEGYRGVLGACWEDCPEGFTDMGLFCTSSEWPVKFQDKDTFAQDLVALQCASGQVNEAGLCYEPCEENFTGVGPLCFEQFGNETSVARVRDQVDEQHQAALAQAGDGGIVIAAEETPQLTTDIAFTPIICSLDMLDGVFGLSVPDLASLAALATDATNDAILKAISDALEGDTNSAWLVPSLAETVLFDFTAEATCEDDGVVATASLNLNPSLTVQASTRMFDPVLHNMAGVDLGIMSISVYELIPFRIYGTVGANVSADASLKSELDRTLPAVVVEGKQFADNLSIDIVPELDFWLSAEAYIRVTSILNFIPDLLQLGAEFKLYVLELITPYQLEQGLREGEEGYEVFKTEHFETQLASGHGYMDVFLRILGIETGAFDDSDLEWEGYRENNVVIDKQEVEVLDL